MFNLLSKSANGLMRNENSNLENLMNIILREQRLQRSDLQDLKLMINKILIDKHLQTQVDSYFEDSPEHELEDK